MKEYIKPNIEQEIIGVVDVVLSSIVKDEGTNNPGEGPGMNI